MSRPWLTNHRRWPVLTLVALACVTVGLVAAMQTAGAPRKSRSHIASSPRIARTAGASSPNIVFILTDDLSMDLLPYMPHVQEMEQRGMSFNDYFVSDSLCCPSRASIFSGNFPHDTGVFANAGPQGGFRAFYERGEEQSTFAVALQQAGYRTALMGKYLNRYMQGSVPGLSDTYVPPGWSEWDGVGWGYPEFNYWLNENGTLHYYGDRPSDYLTDVLANKGVQFIDRSVGEARPFFLELSTFAPHAPYTPAPQDAESFPGLTAPRPPSFDRLPLNPPAWLADHRPLTPREIDGIDNTFRRRVQSVQAVDRMIGQIEQTLAERGVADKTYLVFSSDNGLHTGEYRLTPGKLTAFDTDIQVPLVVVGPGVPAGTTTDAMAENIDLAPTFAAMGGTSLPSDGANLLPVLDGAQPGDWRNTVLIEHHGNDLSGGDPDFQQPASGSPRTYEAMRTHQFLYVEYNDGERELYDLINDPFELDNLAPALSSDELAQLHEELLALENCHDGPACWAAMHVAPDAAMIRRLTRLSARFVSRYGLGLRRHRHHARGARRRHRGAQRS